jgi:hypothetical protein
MRCPHDNFVATVMLVADPTVAMYGYRYGCMVTDMNAFDLIMLGRS